MRLALVTDAWTPQVNGVVRTLSTTVDIMRERGHDVLTVTPDKFRTVPMPSYPEIRLAITRRKTVARMIEAWGADAVHIATEGPLGHAARAHCVSVGRAFSTSFHTRFPDYVKARTGLPASLTWRWLRRFHQPARAILAATPRLAAELRERGLRQVQPWSRGVDLARFRPGQPAPAAYAGLPRPILLSVGRVAVEKNVEAFLRAPAPGTKVVVGDGPALSTLSAAYPAAVFLGALHGDALAAAYSAADLFVFPSRTDTFGLVMIEALASGLPVAAFPVPGPLDVLGDSGGAVGIMDTDLGVAIAKALQLDRAKTVAFARRYSWESAADQFELAVALAHDHPPPRRALRRLRQMQRRMAAAGE